MKDKYDYIIKEKNDSEYEVHKFFFGDLEATYHVNLNLKTSCDCISGRVRKYCKHKDWVHAVRHGGELPKNVAVALDVTPEDLAELVKDFVPKIKK